MLRDFGSRDAQFIEVVHDVKRRLLKLAEISEDEFCVIPLQGSGSYAVEGVLSSVIPPQGSKLCLIINGAYGQRMLKTTRAHGIPTLSLAYQENQQPDLGHINE